MRSTRPEYLKKWLLHTVARPEAPGLRVLRGSPDGGILETDAPRLRVANGRGRLLVAPLAGGHPVALSDGSRVITVRTDDGLGEVEAPLLPAGRWHLGPA